MPAMKLFQRHWAWISASTALLVASVVVLVAILIRNAVAGQSGAYAEALRTGDFNAAYDMLCDQTHQQLAREDFVQPQVEDPQRIASYEVQSVSFPSMLTGRPVARVWAQDTSHNEYHYEWTFTLENGHWRMCGGKLAEEGVEVVQP